MEEAERLYKYQLFLLANPLVSSLKRNFCGHLTTWIPKYVTVKWLKFVFFDIRDWTDFEGHTVHFHFFISIFILGFPINNLYDFKNTSARDIQAIYTCHLMSKSIKDQQYFPSPSNITVISHNSAVYKWDPAFKNTCFYLAKIQKKYT